MTTESALTIRSRAPTRIDLAGGTVDIWPLYLFLNSPRTLNMGIDLHAETTLESRPLAKADPKPVTLRSSDQNAELRLSWDGVLGDASAPPSLELHLKLLRFFARERERMKRLDRGRALTLGTTAKSPAGAGLGGSSTLSISMIGAIATWAREMDVEPERDGERFIEIVRDTETTVIQVPAGLQDYYGAMFGGLQSLAWGAGTHSRSKFDAQLLNEVGKRVLLFYSGHSRNSGINNWALFKAFIDKQGDVNGRFQSIVDATHALEAALEKRDWVGASRAIASEWSVRRTLAEGISTPEITRAFEIVRKASAESSGKICGAGGGGCFYVFVPSADPALMRKISEEVSALGLRSLPFRPAPLGLEVKASRE